jgi:small-conductance mechanosensitive channel
MMILQKILHYSLFRNTVREYAVALGIFLSLLVLIGILRRLFLAPIRNRVPTTGGMFMHRLVRAFEKHAIPFLILLAVYASIQDLRLSVTLHKIVHICIVVLPIFFVVRFLLSLVTLGLERRWKRSEVPESAQQSMRVVQIIIQVIVWVIAGIALFDNLGIKISTLVAGLGIGGIAVALASQTVLGDLFAFIMILFDRPFEVGDFIVVNEFMGTVSQIGIKSTRIRSVDGEMIVFHNTDLTNARIRNYRKMEERRVLFTLGVSRATKLPDLKKIPMLIGSIIRSIPQTRLDRAHFKAYGDFSLVYEVVYYVLTPDYNTYMDIQQTINFRIREEFDALDIRLAFPAAAVTPAPREGDK